MPDTDEQETVDIDGVLVLTHSEKQDAAATWKKTSGHHPLTGLVDHGRGGASEPVVGLLQPGNTGSNTTSDHIEAARITLAQPPKRYRHGRQTQTRCDSGGSTQEFAAWLAARERSLSYSVGMTITHAIHQTTLKVPASARTPAVDPDGTIRDSACITEIDTHSNCPTNRPTDQPTSRPAEGDTADRPQGTPGAP